MQDDADSEPAAGYRLASRRATTRATGGAAVGPRLRQVLGAGFLDSARGHELVQRLPAWLGVCDAALDRLLELVPLQRLVQVYRAPLRVERQVPAAAYELYAAALIVDVVRGLEIEVATQGARRADLRAHFLSITFHVEVKTHEAEGQPGGLRAARALVQAAAGQASLHTPNLLVLGRMRPQAVARIAAEPRAAERFGAIAWVDLRPGRGACRARLHAVAPALHPFPPALLEVLTATFTSG
jgi:hypothetical protein